MAEPIEATGRHATLAFDGHYVTITHHRMSSHGHGHDRIPVTQINSLRWKPAGAAMSGFIQFTPSGQVADGFTIAFTRKQQPAFEAVKSALEQAIVDHQDQAGHSVGPSTADELTKLATLLQQEVLSEDEFAVAKARILA